MNEMHDKLSADLVLRLLVIAAAFHLACAWMQTSCAPWPLVDAFDLADSFEEQLFQSLGISFSGLKEALCYKVSLLLVAKGSLEVGSCQNQMLLRINFLTHCDLLLPSIQIQRTRAAW